MILEKKKKRCKNYLKKQHNQLIITKWKQSIIMHSVRMRENTDRKKLHIWTLLTQCLLIKNEVLVHQIHNSLNSINPEFMQSYIKVKHVTINIRNAPMSKLPKTNSDSMDYLHKFRRIFIMEQNILVH